MTATTLTSFHDHLHSFIIILMGMLFLLLFVLNSPFIIILYSIDITIKVHRIRFVQFITSWDLSNLINKSTLNKSENLHFDKSVLPLKSIGT